MTRPSRVVIDKAALRHNLQRIRELAPNSRVMAIIKADAYGHGIVRVARTLTDADAFGVAFLEEAEQLREAGITTDIVLLEGMHKASSNCSGGKPSRCIPVSSLSQTCNGVEMEACSSISTWCRL